MLPSSMRFAKSPLWYTVATEYAKDELRRDPPNIYFAGNDVLGYINEFPESGLVPSSYLYGFVGVEAIAGGISLEPNIPEQYEFTGVKDLVFGDGKYNIAVHKNGKAEIIGKSGLNLKINLADYCNLKTVKVTTYNLSGVKVSENTVSAINGVFKLDYKGQPDT